MGSGRRCGDRGGAARPRRRLGLGTFLDDEGGYTTVAVAVALLMSLVLTFGTAAAAWSLSRSADVQEVADAVALAGSNVVAGYATVAQVMDACVLSMGLLGSMVCAVGLVVAAIPVVSRAAPAILREGRKILDARKGFARSSARGLQRLERAIPSLVMASSASCARASSAGGVPYSGVAVPLPRQGRSDFSSLDDGLGGEELEQRGQRIAEASARKRDADERASRERERAWRADNVDDPLCMRSRADSLAGLPAAQNPAYPSPEAWEFEYARVRACNYYLARWEAEPCAGNGPDELQRSCARKEFYRYAYQKISRATCVDGPDEVGIDLPELPHNRDMVRGTELYTDVVWPCTLEEGGVTLHCSLSCPGATGPSAGSASLAEEEGGGVLRCEVCRMDAKVMGNVANASTNIPNGFEHYWRIVVEASRSYQRAREESIAAGRDMRDAAEEGRGTFREAIDLLSVPRPKLVPPGAYGCVSVVRRGESVPVPSGLTAAFLSQAELPEGCAIAGATLAPDDSTDGSDVLSSVFEGVTRGCGGLVLDFAGDVVGAWGRLLVSYGSSYESASRVAEDMFDGIGPVFGERVASWLRSELSTLVRDAGFEPADMRVRKPVLVNSQEVMDKAGLAKGEQVRRAIESIPASPGELAERLEGEVRSMLGDGEVVLAEVPIPGMGERGVPLVLDLSTLGGVA